jgi:hypothetical protein
MGFDPMCVTTKRILKKLGGDKITNKYTFDGNIEGKEYVQLSETMFLVKVSDVPISVSKFKSVSVVLGEFNSTLLAEELQIENDEAMGVTNISNTAGIPMATIVLKDVDVGISISKGIYVAMDKSSGFLVYAIEFTETIHPIDLKYLHGVTTINLDEYGIDLMSLFATGGGSQSYEVTGFWEKINEADGNVQFVTNIGMLAYMIPSMKSYKEGVGWTTFGFSLMSTPGGGSLVNTIILIGHSGGNVVVTMKLE